jgi:hypothetical protein
VAGENFSVSASLARARALVTSSWFSASSLGGDLFWFLILVFVFGFCFWFLLLIFALALTLLA